VPAARFTSAISGCCAAWTLRTLSRSGSTSCSARVCRSSARLLIRVQLLQQDLDAGDRRGSRLRRIHIRRQLVQAVRQSMQFLGSALRPHTQLCCRLRIVLAPSGVVQHLRHRRCRSGTKRCRCRKQAPGPGGRPTARRSKGRCRAHHKRWISRRACEF
jgi:hypothetical protein